MKKLFSLFVIVSTMIVTAHATSFTFNSADSQTKDGITVSFAQGSGSNAPVYNTANSQMRLYANNTITVSGGTITSISIEFTKQGSKDYASLTASAGNLVSGGNSTSKDDVKTDNWTGSASSVIFTLGDKGQRVIKSITVNGTGTTGDDEGGNEGGDEGGEGDDSLDDSYVYSEPTVVENHDSIGNNMTYSFIQNNIKVDCSTGARTGSYFSCNAGQTITFTASKNIKALVINGYVKKGFEATATAGDIDFVDASESEVTANPVVVVYDIDAKAVTLNCVKQLRCYEVKVYFEANPDVEIGGGGSGEGDEGEYNFDYEPTTKSSFNINFGDSTYVEDMTSDFGIIDLYMWNDDYDAELYFIVDAADANTIIPVGTYPISAAETANTVLASPGGDEMYDYPSVMMTGYEYDSEWDEWYYTEAYYLASGTVTVAQNGNEINGPINALSHFGSTLNLSCQYEVEERTDLRDVVRQSNASKLMRNGRLLIRRNGKTFNAQGAAL